eukprot:565468-Alexandrium_andersonii.AAC.1
MSASLVGSEMCIRDRSGGAHLGPPRDAHGDRLARTVGDLNADLEDLGSWAGLAQLGWADIGALFAPAGGPAATCFARAGSPGTRLDYVLCSAALAPLVAGYQVETVAAMATHCALHLDIRVESPAYE